MEICVSMTSPISLMRPSLKLFEIKKVLIEGTNTIVIPETIPESDKGNTTFVRVCLWLQPRSCAASMRRLSSLASTE